MYKQKNKEANAELKERENTNKKMKQEHARLKQKINNTEREKESIDKEIKELEKVGPRQICKKKILKNCRDFAETSGYQQYQSYKKNDY